MFIRTTTLALGAAAAIAALTPTTASAYGGHFGLHGPASSGIRTFPGGGFHPHYPSVWSRLPRHYPPVWSHLPRHYPPVWSHAPWYRPWNHYWWLHRPQSSSGYPQSYPGSAAAMTPAMVTPAAMTPGATPAPQPGASCNCLTKQYLPDGRVAFSDVCTNEAAVAPPAPAAARQ